MKELVAVYEGFFSQFVNTIGSPPNFEAGSAVNAFVAGSPAMERLPSGMFAPARFPYIVYEMAVPRLWGNAVLNVSIWDRDLLPSGAPGRPNFYGRVNDIATQILSKIHPENGVILPVANGQFLQLLRGDIPFQVVSTSEIDPTFARAVVSLLAFSGITR